MQQRVNIVLASASPRRKDLMQQMGLDFTVHAFPIDEKSSEDNPKKKVSAIVEQKMNAALENLSQSILENSCVICADTVVVIEKTVLGKASTKEQASAMLHLLSGKVHEVITAFSIHQSNKKSHRELVSTQVEFMPLTNSMVDEYLNHDEYKDKAGSYAIQGLAGRFVKSIKGSYSNVIGLPQVQVFEALQTLGVIGF